MKKALLAVALMMAAMTGWGKMSEWNHLGIISPNMQDWDSVGTIGFSDFAVNSEEEAAEIDAAIIAGAEEVNFNALDFASANSLTHIGEVLDSENFTNDQYDNDRIKMVEHVLLNVPQSTPWMIYTYSKDDSILKEYYVFSWNEDGEAIYNHTWNSFGAVPEPASGLLIVMGSVLLAFRRKVA